MELINVTLNSHMFKDFTDNMINIIFTTFKISKLWKFGSNIQTTYLTDILPMPTITGTRKAVQTFLLIYFGIYKLHF
jgi:hypothetical protein